MILSDWWIKKRLASWDLKIYSEENKDIISQVWPASLDFRLWNIIKFYDKHQISAIDPRSWLSQENIWTFYVQDGDYFLIHPWQFVLWVTKETISVPDDLVARCEWRSSLWRLWLIIHSTAWFIDPWFKWTITLEITNINEVPVKLYPGMRVGQFAFEQLDFPCEVPYNKRKGSKYMNQKDTQVSRVFDDSDF